jgi:hypothetical protein
MEKDIVEDKIFNDFIDGINTIEKELRQLEGKYDILLEKIKNSNILEKENIMNIYENLLMSITHEVGTEISFYRQDIIRMNNYIQFRIKYNDLTENELMKIIDQELTLEEKNKLNKKFNGIIQLTKGIKNDWNNIFPNIGYVKLRNKLKIIE